MITDSPRTLLRYDHALDAFGTAYVAYLQTGEGLARARAVTALPAAHEALDALGFEPVVMPPPAFGGYTVRGLYNTAFYHERYSDAGDIVRMNLDLLGAAKAQVQLQREELARRRRNPLYWGDRLLRAILGFPVYLAGLFLRVPPERIDASGWGTVLRVAGVAATTLAVVGGWLGWP